MIRTTFLKKQTTMASMKFSAKTVMNIMSIVDDHKEGVQEAEYIEMCNALKFLHQIKMKSEHKQQEPTTATHRARLVQRFQHQIEHYRYLLQSIDNGNYSPPPTRMTNDIKMTVLRAICAEMNQEVPSIPGHTCSSRLVKKVETFLIELGMTQTAIKSAYNTKRRVITEEIRRSELNRQISEFELYIQRMQQQQQASSSIVAMVEN